MRNASLKARLQMLNDLQWRSELFGQERVCISGDDIVRLGTAGQATRDSVSSGSARALTGGPEMAFDE